MICKTANLETLLTRPPFRSPRSPPRAFSSYDVHLLCVSLPIYDSLGFTLYLVILLPLPLRWPLSVFRPQIPPAFLFPTKRLQTRIQDSGYCHSLALPVSFRLCSMGGLLFPARLPVSSAYLLQATLNAGLARDNPRPLPPPATPPTPRRSHPPRASSVFLFHITRHLFASPFSPPVHGPPGLTKQLTNTQVA